MIQSAEGCFDELYSNRNYLLRNTSKKDLLNSLLVTDEHNADAIVFLKEKIRVCRDVLKYNAEDSVVQEELKNYEFILFNIKFNSSLIVELIQNLRLEMEN